MKEVPKEIPFNTKLAGKKGKWKCGNCGDITTEEISNCTLSTGNAMSVFGWGCDKWCKDEYDNRGRKILISIVTKENKKKDIPTTITIHPSFYCPECGHKQTFTFNKPEDIAKTKLICNECLTEFIVTRRKT